MRRRVVGSVSGRVIVRERDRHFVDAMMRNLDAGQPEDAAAIAAYRESHAATGHGGAPWTDATVARAASAKLEKRVVREAMAGYLRDETGMTPGEMLKIRVGFARGEKTETKVLRGGKGEADELVEVPISATTQLKALEGLERLVFVAPTQRVEVDAHTSLSAVLLSDLGGGVPAMDPRPVEGKALPLAPVTIEAEDEDE